MINIDNWIGEESLFYIQIPNHNHLCTYCPFLYATKCFHETNHKKNIPWKKCQDNLIRSRWNNFTFSSSTLSATCDFLLYLLIILLKFPGSHHCIYPCAYVGWIANNLINKGWTKRQLVASMYIVDIAFLSTKIINALQAYSSSLDI